MATYYSASIDAQRKAQGVRPGPYACMPIQAGYDKETHDITHEPYNPLCDACVRGRASANPVRNHGRRETKFPPKERKAPQIDFDFVI